MVERAFAAPMVLHSTEPVAPGDDINAYAAQLEARDEQQAFVNNMNADPVFRGAKLALDSATQIPDAANDFEDDPALDEARQMAKIQAQNMQLEMQRKFGPKPAPLSAHAQSMLQMPASSVNIHQLMGKMVMSDMFDQDELDAVQAALNLKAKTDLRKQKAELKAKLQKDVQQTGPQLHREVLFQMEEHSALLGEATQTFATKKKSAVLTALDATHRHLKQHSNQDAKRETPKHSHGQMLQQRQKEQEASAQMRDVQKVANQMAKKEEKAGTAEANEVQHMANKMVRAVVNRAHSERKSLKKEAIKLAKRQMEKQASVNPTGKDIIGQLHYKIKNLDNKLARAEDKVKVAWEEKAQEDSMLQKMEVEARDTQVQAHKQYRKNLDNYGQRMIRAEEAAQMAHRALQICHRKVADIQDTQDTELTKTMNVALDKLNKVKLASAPIDKKKLAKWAERKVTKHLVAPHRPMSRLCKACSKLTATEHAQLGLECNACTLKKSNQKAGVKNAEAARKKAPAVAEKLSAAAITKEKVQKETSATSPAAKAPVSPNPSPPLPAESNQDPTIDKDGVPNHYVPIPDIHNVKVGKRQPRDTRS